MSREQFLFPGQDGLEIVTFRWPAQDHATAIVQIAHGMAEHAQRYDHVAEFLNQAGYHVYANDHRGHGQTGTRSNSVGSFGAGGWNALVVDMAKLTALAREREHGLPVILLGHSMGSIAAQQYILERSADIAAVVLSGSVATDLLAMNSNPDGDLTSLNKVFEPARTPFDWLSRDPVEVDKYVADPLCGYQLSPESMMSLGASMMRLGDANELGRIRKDLPIYIFAGDADPLNQKLEWLRPVAERYRDAGIKDVSEKYYPDARHEVLNEINRDEVMRDLLSWIRRAVR